MNWLGRSEGYIRTLRHHRIEPSVETLTVCAHKLGYYADQMRGSDDAHPSRSTNPSLTTSADGVTDTVCGPCVRQVVQFAGRCSGARGLTLYAISCAISPRCGNIITQ